MYNYSMLQMNEEIFGLRLPDDFSVDRQIESTFVVHRLYQFMRSFSESTKITLVCGTDSNAKALPQLMKLSGVFTHRDKQVVFKATTAFQIEINVEEIKNGIAEALGIMSPDWFDPSPPTR